MQTSHRSSGPRIGPLALAIALGAASAGHCQAPHEGATLLRNELRAVMPPVASAPRNPAALLPVASCADDGGSGTLRAVVAAAGEGDTVDLSALTCSTITLTQGAIPVLLNELTIAGPGAAALAIDGAGVDRVFLHPGGATLTVRDLAVRNGAARVTGYHITGGGCIASAGYLVFDHSEVSHCYASGEGVYGGAVFAYGVRMYASTLASNVGRGVHPTTGTAVFGGGAYAGYVLLVNSSVSGNRAENGGPMSSYDTGGGVFANSGGTIYRSTIDGNYSGGLGGGFSAFGGYVDVVDSTISGNVAKSGSGGGLDIRVFYGGHIGNSTIAGNHAAAGGGVYLRGLASGFVLQSTLIAGNAAPAGAADLGASVLATVSGANNLVVAAGANVTVPPDTLHADPLLQPLAANGGPTRTRALSPGSPALDAGNNEAALTTDQRGDGFPRVLGAAADIGAFEGSVALPPAPPPLAVPLASRGVLALLATLIGLIGLSARSRSRRRPSFFTAASPRKVHSSQT
jgi:hypothetical protein